MHLSASPHRLALTGPRSLLQPVPAAGALAGAFGGFAQVLPICLPRGVEPLESAYPPARTHARMHARTREHIEVVSILKCMHSACDRMLSVEARARAKGSHLAPRSLAQWCIYVYVYI